MIALAVLNAPTVPCNTHGTDLGLAASTVVKAQALCNMHACSLHMCHIGLEVAAQLCTRVPCVDQVTQDQSEDMLHMQCRARSTLLAKTNTCLLYFSVHRIIISIICLLLSLPGCWLITTPIIPPCNFSSSIIHKACVTWRYRMVPSTSVCLLNAKKKCYSSFLSLHHLSGNTAMLAWDVKAMKVLMCRQRGTPRCHAWCCLQVILIS